MTNIQGVPEFPSWTPTLLALVVLAALLVVYKKRAQERGAA